MNSQADWPATLGATSWMPAMTSHECLGCHCFTSNKGQICSKQCCLKAEDASGTGAGSQVLICLAWSNLQHVRNSRVCDPLIDKLEIQTNTWSSETMGQLDKHTEITYRSQGFSGYEVMMCSFPNVDCHAWWRLKKSISWFSCHTQRHIFVNAPCRKPLLKRRVEGSKVVVSACHKHGKAWAPFCDCES